MKTPLLVKDALDRYYKEHVAVKVVARRRAEYAMEALNSFFADTPISAIDIKASRKYLAHRQKKSIANTTVRRELVVLLAAANHCVKWRHLLRTDMPSVELPPHGESKTTWLYRDELERLFDAADGRAKWFISLAYNTAARKETIETLGWNQVDFEMKRINLNRPGRERTAKRRPIVPITETLCNALQGLYEEQRAEGCYTGWVLGASGDIRGEFDRITRLAGLSTLPERGMRPESALTPHVLRHSRATHLLQDRKPPYAVANLLGDSLTTLLKTYGHVCPDYMADALF